MGEAVRDILAGTIAGVCATLTTQPLDLIRVRIQTQAEAGGRHVESMREAARVVWEAHGFRGFFRGLAAPLLANAPINATIFASERAAARAFASLHDSIPAHALSGAVSGLAQVPFSVPAELVKLQLQVDHGLREPYASSWHCARSIIAEHGLSGLYRGGGLTTLRDVCAFSIYFASYHELRAWLATPPRRTGDGSTAATPRHVHGREPATVSTLGLMMAGGTAGVLSWLGTYPVDTLKSIVQGLPLSTPREQRTLSYVLRQHANREGGSFRFLLRGLAPTLWRAFPNSAVIFPVFEYVTNLIDKYSEGDA